MIPFRHCIREPHGSAVKFEILAAAPNEFQVRYPDYDYIKMGVGPSVMYNREQLLCFLLTYDKAECLEFMEKLYHHMGWSTEKLHETCVCRSDKGERGMIARFLQNIVVRH